MPEVIELNLRPTGPDPLSWSADGALAIAASTDLHILFPRSRRANILSTDPTIDTDDEWEHIYFEIASYPSTIWPVEIWPRGTPSSFFLAREQRQSEVIGVQWSPPGLASHDRCVLGVLTSNGLLSIIKPGGMERAVSAWKRICVISAVEPGVKVEDATAVPDLVDDADVEQVPSTATGVPREKDKKILVLDGQIRGWAWAPAALNARPKFWAAVTTETSLYVVRLTIDGDDMHPIVEAQLDIPTEKPAESLEDEVQMHQHGCHLLWHDVDHQATEDKASEKRSYVLLSFHGRLRQIVVKHTPEDAQQLLNVEWTKDSVPGYGAVAFSSGRLFYGHDDELHSMVYKPQQFPQCGTISTSRLKGWDPAFAMRRFHDGIIAAQPLSLASYTHSSASDGISTSYVQANHRSYLAKQIANSCNDFADEFELDDATTVSLYGIATYTDNMTNKQWLTAIVSFAPNDQIQYKMKTNERVSLIFSHEDLEFRDPDEMDVDDDDAADDLQFPWYIDTKPDIGPDDVHSNTLILLPKLHLEKSAETKMLVMLLLFQKIITRSSMKSVQEALKVLKRFDDGEWEKAYGSMLKALDPSTSGVEVVNTLIRRMQQNPTFAEYVEHCTIPGCGSPVGFVDVEDVLESAACQDKGHQFARCSLTLLAIQQPYISKQCEGCSRTFLDQEKVDQAWESVKIIANHFKQCPYCGSKFVG